MGTTREVLLAEFGTPAGSGVTNDGRRYEKFVFNKGASSGAKTGRALIHVVADILTYGLWEVVATPTEKTLAANKVVYEVIYDKHGRVNQWAQVKEPVDRHYRAESPQRYKTGGTSEVKERAGLLPYRNYRPAITPNQKQVRTLAPSHGLRAGDLPYQTPRTGTQTHSQRVALSTRS